MTYSYDINLANDEDLVRFHIGDTNTNGNYLEDETITAQLTITGSVGGATIACLKYIITQLASPDFKQDWMSVSNKEARAGFEMILKNKAQEFGISLGASMTSTIKHPYRDDSDQYTSTTRDTTTQEEKQIYDGSP